MILIIDSGSTKSDWILIDSQGEFVDSYKTMGFNPFFHSTSLIEGEIRKNASILGIASRVRQVFYYGAGCSSAYYNGIVAEALRHIFDQSEVHVDHDLMASAYATYSGQPGISCILGTGSNSCFFDGAKLSETVPALGYILGDEGSGSYFGKKLLTAFLYKQLPKGVHQHLIEEFQLSKAEIFKNVYEKPNANVYLASFTRFISQYKDLPYFQEMLKSGMRHFMKEHVLCYENYREVPTHFVGSVAFYFQEALLIAAADLEVNVGQIIKSPIQNLVQYHVKYHLIHA